jgi:hypothetical protein
MNMPGLWSARARCRISRQSVALENGNMVKMARERLGRRQAAHARTNDDDMLSY